jgi:hypothetical protein
VARVKQTARQSTREKAPRSELARKAARKPRGGPVTPSSSESAQRTLSSLSALSRDECSRLAEFDEEASDGPALDLVVPCTEIHPLVVGFLKLLSPGTIVSVSTLQVLLDDTILNPEVGGTDENDEDSPEFVPFEPMRLTQDPTAARNNDIWVIEGRGRREMENGEDEITPAYSGWTRVSSLACCGRANGREITFHDYAEEDRRRRDMLKETIQMVATSILSTFRDCQTKIWSMAGFDRKKPMTTKDFAHGSRIPSTTPIRHSAVTVPTPFSRENDPLFSCVPASLDNLLYDVYK